MNIFTLSIMLSILLATSWHVVPARAEGASEKWSGVDETVIGEFAESMGKTPSDPIINIFEGDLLLSMFLLFGVIGGFIAGYYFRELFPPKKKEGGS